MPTIPFNEGGLGRRVSRVELSKDWEARFWSKVDRGGLLECWMWNAPLNSAGRPSFHVGGRVNGKRISASRYSYWLAKGYPPEGKVVCHTCDNPACVNPAHLWAGTQAENLADMTAKGRRSRFALRGEAAPGCKVSDEEARRALARVDAGESPSAVARDLGINRVTIYKLRERLAR